MDKEGSSHDLWNDDEVLVLRNWNLQTLFKLNSELSRETVSNQEKLVRSPLHTFILPMESGILFFLIPNPIDPPTH